MMDCTMTWLLICLCTIIPGSWTFIPEDAEALSRQVVASDQLPNYAKNHPNGSARVATDDAGRPVPSLLASLTIGRRGPMLMQDANFMQILANFDQERIPERIVHAKGAGAHGYFEVTSDVGRKYSKATLFSEVGKKTPIFARFSQEAGESGTPDTPPNSARGFAIKFYTEEGNWDIAGLNLPIFFAKDPIQQVHIIHSFKRNPVSNTIDPNAWWDLLSLRDEMTHFSMQAFSDLGCPDGYRHMDGHGVMTYKLVNEKGESVYCKFHWLTRQGLKNISLEESEYLAGHQRDYAIADMYNNIARGNYPAWDFYIQTMTTEQAAAAPFDPFDDTFEWYEKDYPYQKVGHFVLNRNPRNYFAEVEQVAFTPSSLIPGVEQSPDPMFQGRTYSYPDSQRHRLGSNANQIPINAPRALVNSYGRDGLGVRMEADESPNYYPNSFQGPSVDLEKGAETPFNLTGVVKRYEQTDNGDKYYLQARQFWLKLDPSAQHRLVKNIALPLTLTNLPHLVDRIVARYTKVHPDMGAQLKEFYDNITGKNK